MNAPRDHIFIIINPIAGGAPGRMPAFRQPFIDADIRAMIADIRSLQPES